MLKLDEMTLKLPKVSFLLASWGLLIFLGGCISQWFGLNADFTLVLWGGVTILGIMAQIVCMVRGLGPNLSAWLVVMVLGWAFTFYVTKFDNGAHADLYGDLAGVWLILLALGYVATSFQVDKRFFIIAGLHLVSGVVLELSARRVITVELLDAYSSLLFGLVGGLPLILAALPVWYEQKQKQEQPQLIAS